MTTENILYFKGDITFSNIGRLLTALKHKIVEKGIKMGVYKRILSVMIEALENVYKYSDQYRDKQEFLKNYLPAFSLDREGTVYTIKTSNPVKNNHLHSLIEKIDVINMKSPEDIKLLYRHTILNGKFTEKGGAGLGLIEMVKISRNPIVYSLEPISEGFTMFNLVLTVT